MKKLILSATFLALIITGSAAIADTYALDLSHASVGFCAKHLVISTVCGRFKEFDSTIILDESDITKSSWTGTIKTASISTDNDKRDEHLKSADFLDVQKYPEITFKSTKIEKKGEGYVANGTLTIRGVSKDVSIPFTLNGPIEAFGSKKIGVSGSTTINRQDFGVAWSKKLDNGGLVVSDEVKITLDAEAGVKK